MTGIVFVAGLLLGTLLNIIIIRLPRERSLPGWPLRCTRTGEPLAWWQLLPVAGWLIQRGKARDGRPLHWIFPLVEVLTATSLTVLFLTYGFSASFLYLSFVCIVLIVTGAIDWLHRWIYTFVMLGSVPLVLLLSVLLDVPSPGLLNAAMGALAGGLVFIFLWFLGRVLFPAHAVPFGLGDVYLAIFIGAAVGLTNFGPAILYGVLMAGVASAGIVAARHLLHRGDMPTYISYGSYLCLGSICYILLRGL